MRCSRNDPFRMRSIMFKLFRVVPALLLVSAAAAQEQRAVPDLRELVAKPQSEMADVVRRYEADRGSLQRTYTMPSSPPRIYRMKRFHTSWSDAIKKIDADKLTDAGRADLKRLSETVDRELQDLDAKNRDYVLVGSLLPFRNIVYELVDNRRLMERVDPARAAAMLSGIRKDLDGHRKQLDEFAKGEGVTLPTRSQVMLAAELTMSLRAALKSW